MNTFNTLNTDKKLQFLKGPTMINFTREGHILQVLPSGSRICSGCCVPGSVPVQGPFSPHEWHKGTKCWVCGPSFHPAQYTTICR